MYAFAWRRQLIELFRYTLYICNYSVCLCLNFIKVCVDVFTADGVHGDVSPVPTAELASGQGEDVPGTQGTVRQLLCLPVCHEAYQPSSQHFL